LWVSEIIGSGRGHVGLRLESAACAGRGPTTRERIAEAEGIEDKRRHSLILARVPRPRQYDSQ